MIIVLSKCCVMFFLLARFYAKGSFYYLTLEIGLDPFELLLKEMLLVLSFGAGPSGKLGLDKRLSSKFYY